MVTALQRELEQLMLEQAANWVNQQAALQLRVRLKENRLTVHERKKLVRLLKKIEDDVDGIAT